MQWDQIFLPSVGTDGELDHRTARREFITAEELHSQLRLHGFENVTEVRRALIEPNGMISFMGYDEAGTR